MRDRRVAGEEKSRLQEGFRSIHNALEEMTSLLDPHLVITTGEAVGRPWWARVEEVRKRASSIRAAGLISSFLQIAETYDRLALAEDPAGETTEPDVSDEPRS